MDKNIKKLLFILGMMIYALIYYLEVMNLRHFEDRILISVVFWLLVVMSLVAVVKSLNEIRKEKREEKLTEVFSNVNLSSRLFNKKAFLFYSMVIYIVLIPIVGFFTTSFFIFILLSYLLGARKFLIIILTDTGLCAGMYYLFVILLRLRVPTGIFI